MNYDQLNREKFLGLHGWKHDVLRSAYWRMNVCRLRKIKASLSSFAYCRMNDCRLSIGRTYYGSRRGIFKWCWLENEELQVEHEKGFTFSWLKIWCFKLLCILAGERTTTDWPWEKLFITNQSITFKVLLVSEWETAGWAREMLSCMIMNWNKQFHMYCLQEIEGLCKLNMKIRENKRLWIRQKKNLIITKITRWLSSINASEYEWTTGSCKMIFHFYELRQAALSNASYVNDQNNRPHMSMVLTHSFWNEGEHVDPFCQETRTPINNQNARWHLTHHNFIENFFNFNIECN